MAENPRIVPEIDEPALEVWETLQKRQLKLKSLEELQELTAKIPDSLMGVGSSRTLSRRSRLLNSSCGFMLTFM